MFTLNNCTFVHERGFFSVCNFYFHNSHIFKSLVNDMVVCLQSIRAYWATFNPVSPNGDQDQFSLNDVHTLSRDKVMRINEMITKEKML